MTSGLLQRMGRRSRGEREPGPEGAILEHLRFLLNTRQGSSGLDPGYGVPDFTDIIHNAADGMAVLQRMIADAIKHSEPRLTRIAVVPVGVDKNSLVLRFEVRAQLVAGGTLRFQTEVTRSGHIRVGA